MPGGDCGVRLRVLVLEDEFLTAMDLCSALDALGFEVVGPVSRVAEALTIARAEPLAGALLDVNLEGERSDDVADALVDRAIPFVFTSGYAREDLTSRHRGRPLLQKPLLPAELQAALASFVTGANGDGTGVPP